MSNEAKNIESKSMSDERAVTEAVRTLVTRAFDSKQPSAETGPVTGGTIDEIIKIWDSQFNGKTLGATKRQRQRGIPPLEPDGK
jgi:hypothetical protein